MINKVILISISILLALPNFISIDINEQFRYDNIERFDPALSRINSIDKLDAYMDSAASTNKFNKDSFAYTALLAYTISCRFYHGFSHWKLNENWMAAIGQKITGIGLACKVDPAEIIRHPNAACSQQVLVMMEILRRRHIAYRKVGFPHHYAIEVNIGGHWYFFDPNMEPRISRPQRLEESWKLNNDSLKKYYPLYKPDNLDYHFGKHSKAIVGTLNEIPARRARVFQGCTSVLSKILWCFPIILIFVKRKRKRMHAIKPINHFPVQQNLNPVYYA